MPGPDSILIEHQTKIAMAPMYVVINQCFLDVGGFTGFQKSIPELTTGQPDVVKAFPCPQPPSVRMRDETLAWYRTETKVCGPLSMAVVLKSGCLFSSWSPCWA